MEPNVYVVLDGMAGSCGKGKVMGQLALEKDIDVAISNCMPNAGHTFSNRGITRLFRHIPVSAVNPKTRLFMGAGTAIDMDVLVEEYESNKDILDGREIIVHPLVPLIEQRHKDKEKAVLGTGSTFKGCGACLSEKVMRNPNLKFFKGYKNIKADSNYHQKLRTHLLDAKQKILLEGAQGVDLDLNHSGHYPYVTSRGVSVSQMCNESGISIRRIKEIIMVIRPYPIRISNKTNLGKDIYSGGYANSNELNWMKVHIGALMGIPATEVTKEDIAYYEPFLDDQNSIPELTSVTLKERRVFDIDIAQLKTSVQINEPDSIYLNFFQYLDDDYVKAQGHYANLYIKKPHREYLNWLEEELKTPITTMGTGPDLYDYIGRRPNVKRLTK